MSTLRRTSHLLNHLIPLGLGLTLATVVTGCSATSGPRTGAASKMKTFLSVGDKPLPVVSGEPGSTVAADTGQDVGPGSSQSRRRARPDGRISGRVYDADNHPVPDARVRLAVSGAAGGKVVSTTTDRSGAFTLHGLRPGTEYTVIAETEGDDGRVTGRADARTADTDVRISLGPQDESPTHASGPSRVNRVSDREESGDPEPDPVARPGKADPADGRKPRSAVNEEDLPPAREAEAMAPDDSRSPRSRASVSNRRASTASDRPDAWRRGSTTRVPATTSPAPEAAPVDPEARGTGAAVGELATPNDDGENPLPPALEPTPDSSAAVGPEAAPRPDPSEPGPVSAAPRRVDDRAPDPGRPGFSGLLDTTRRPAAASAFESPMSPTDATTSRPPEDAAPGALVVIPETFGPVVAGDGDPFSGPRPAAPESPVVAPKPRPRRDLRGSSWPAPSTAPPARSLHAGARPSRSSGSDEKARPTWGEVVASAPTPAPDEATSGTGIGPPSPSATKPRDSRRALALRTDGPGRSERASRAVKASFDKPECEYDDRLRRIIDFRLPDLDGKAVRFQDLDADLVLIDFWGTWCPPCRKALPHLVELQERMGNRLKVVGVACEADAPEVSAPKVAEAARKLNVNYPVLLSRNDGSCPLQEALHIQAFPTMILVDRQGRVLWRDQGATPATLARLDRMIDAIPVADQTRRY